MLNRTDVRLHVCRSGLVTIVVALAAVVQAPEAAAPAARNGRIFVIKAADTGQRSGTEFALLRASGGSRFQRVRGSRMEGGQPCVSTSGHRLAYVGWPRPEIVVRRISQLRNRVGPRHVIGRLPVKPDSGFADCAWSSDERSLVIAGYGDTPQREVRGIWIIGRDGTRFRRLPPATKRYPAEPAWSSSGRIAFAAVSTGGGKSSILIMDADGANVRHVTGPGHSPAWSPDGNQLVFVRPDTPESLQIAEHGPVMAADADGGQVHRLRAASSAAVTYSPDGQELLCVGRDSDLNEQLTLSRADGTQAHSFRMPDTFSLGVAVALTWSRSRAAGDSSAIVASANANGV